MTAIFIVICSALAPPATARSDPHTFFVHSVSGEQGDKERFLIFLEQELRDPLLTVETFNRYFGTYLGFTVTSVTDLIEHLRGQDFHMVRCEGAAHDYGITDGGFLTIVERDCYRGEYMLVHVPTGLRVFFGTCGNVQVAPLPLPPPSPSRRPTRVSRTTIITCGFRVLFGCHEGRLVDYWDAGPDDQELRVATSRPLD